MTNSKSLSAYFSRKGNNYVGGGIVNLPIGNTEVIARKIQTLTGSDLFQIQTVQPYPEDYMATTRVAPDELSGIVGREIEGMPLVFSPVTFSLHLDIPP